MTTISLEPNLSIPRFDVTIARELNLDPILYGLLDELPPERELITGRIMLTSGSSSAIVAHDLLGSTLLFNAMGLILIVAAAG